jgi:hypothetical protein
MITKIYRKFIAVKYTNNLPCGDFDHSGVKKSHCETTVLIVLATFNIMTFSITTLSIMTLSITALIIMAV